MEKNDWANVSIENALDGLSMEEIERLEAYYMAEAECLMAFGGQEKKGPLTFMLKHLRATECLFKTLQFPWEGECCSPVRKFYALCCFGGEEREWKMFTGLYDGID